MDNITHTLVAVAISRAGAKRLAPYATPTLIVAASLPDLDILTLYAGSLSYLQHHRGLTHSVLGVTVLAAALTALVWWLARLVQRSQVHSTPSDPRTPLRLSRLFVLCLIGTASHSALDLLNSYGVRLFEPFSHRGYALDLVYIIDPWILVMLALGLSIPGLLRLVTEEIGARPARTTGRLGAILALAAFVAFAGIRQLAHGRAVEVLGSHVYGGLDPLRVSAFPDPLSPFTWHGVVETENTLEEAEVDAAAGEFDATRVRTFYKPETSPALVAAQSTRTVQIFIEFARYPLVTVDTTPEGYTIFLRDLRFHYATRRRRGFIVHLELDKQLRVLQEQFWFPMTVPPHVKLLR